MSNQRRSDEGRASALAISGWPLSRKVALALAIPLLLAATLGGLRVQSDLEESSNALASATQVTILRPAVDYLTSAERAMVAAQSTTPVSRRQLNAAVRDVKAAAEEIVATVETADLTFEQRLQVATVLDLSRAIRDDNTATLSADTWIAQLRQLQSGVTKLIATITSAQDTPEPRLELLAQTLGGRFSLAMQQALGSDDARSRSASQALFSELGAESAAIDRLAGAVDDAEAAVRTLRANNGARTRSVVTGTSTVLGGSAAYLEYDKLADSLLRQVDDGLAATATNARERALFSAGITLFALLAAILLALVISRSLLDPIRRVREGALQVANADLPDAVARIRSGAEPADFVPIDVHSREEIGQLARAVDDLHRQAVTLASGEAQLRAQVGEMFVTLSRRNTTLINQQLNLIETLEKDEEDPKRLESLFRLDHLASRMRRTADSLLILADAPTRSAGWESLTVTEATQAATAGVQDYQRVHIGSTLDSRIGEAAAGDLIHLLTELVDNALSYSSPSTDVTLSTAAAPGGLTIDVADSGLGIPEESLRQINETLGSGADVTPDTARRMGLFVVSRLAQRHGILVTLATNEASGITATVFVPEAVLRDGAPAMPDTAVEPEATLEVVVEPEPAPNVFTIVRDEAPEQGEPAADPEDEPDGEPTEDESESAPSARVIGLPTRSPGSSMGDREVVTGLPSARNTAAPTPQRGGLPLRSRRSRPDDTAATEETPSAPASLEPAVPAAASPFSDVRDHEADPAVDGADTDLRTHPETEAPVVEAPVVEAPVVESTTSLPTRTAGRVYDPLFDPLPEEPMDAPVAEQAAPVEPPAVRAGLGGLPTRRRGGTLTDQEAATKPFRDAAPAAEPTTEQTSEEIPAPAAELATEQTPEETAEETDGTAPTAPEAPAPQAPTALMAGLPTRHRGDTLADQAIATRPFRPAATEAPGAPPAPAALAPTGPRGALDTLPTRQRGGTLTDQAAANRPFRGGDLDTLPTEVTELAERREPVLSPADAPAARTAPDRDRPQVGRASTLARFRPASATRRASYEAAGGGPQQPLLTESLTGSRAESHAPTGGTALATRATTRTALDDEVPVEHSRETDHVLDSVLDRGHGPALEGDSEDTGSIFGSLRSSWLTSAGGSGWQSAEVEAGWQRAEDVAESSKDAPTAGGGLPIRRPGTLLVPGGITRPTTVVPRDPEAIRSRYAAYAAGVSRGRQTSTSSTDDRTH